MAMLGRIHDVLGRVLAVADRLIAVVVSLALATVVTTNACEIALRAAINHSFPWLYEVSLLLGNWIYFLGICLVYYRNRDVVVDFIVRHSPPAIRVPYQLLLNLICVAVLVVVMWYGAALMALQASDYTMGVGIWNPLYTLPVVLGSVLMIAILIHQSLSILLGRPLPSPHAVDIA